MLYKKYTYFSLSNRNGVSMTDMFPSSKGGSGVILLQSLQMKSDQLYFAMLHQNDLKHWIVDQLLSFMV